MSGGIIKRCAALHAADEIAPATGFVRYVRNTDDTEVVSGPYCDPCQALRCRSYRHREMTREIREVGAVPLDYRERMAEARREGIKRRLRHEIGSHLGTPEQVADDLLSVILELDSGVARELAAMVRARLEHAEVSKRADAAFGTPEPEPIDWSWTGERERED